MTSRVNVSNCQNCDRPDSTSIDDMVFCELHMLRNSVQNLASECAESKEMFKEINAACKICLEKVNFTVEELKSNSAASESSVTVPNNTGALPESRVQSGVKTYTLSKMLPCKTLDELNDFLLKLAESEEFYNGLVSYIQLTFGKDVRKSIKKSLDLIMEKNVQKQLSWTGLRTNKPSFEKRYKLIVSAIDEAFKEKFTHYHYSVLSKKVQTLLQCS